jgi:hypothetical protein
MEVIFIATMMEAAIVVLLLAIVVVTVQVLRGQIRKRPMPERLEAKAIILSVEQTGLFMNHQPQVKVQIQVLPDRGRNFVAEVKQVFSFLDLAQIRTGSTVTVKYNPSNIKEVVLVKAA